MADTAAGPIAGTAYFHVDGQNYALKGDLTYQLAGGKNDPIMGMDGLHGYKSTPTPGKVKGKFSNTANVSVGALNGITNATVTVELVNGKVIVGRNMFRSGEPIEADGMEGDFEFELTGPDVREIST